MGGVIAVLLVSTISSMIFAGPRIVQTMGEDLPALRLLAVRSATGVPVRALLLQTGLTLLFILITSFQQVMVYAGFILNLFTFLTVLGLLVLRWRQPNLPRPYRAWGYPLTPAIFLALSGWTLTFIVQKNPAESLYGLLTLLGGVAVYALTTRRFPLPSAALKQRRNLHRQIQPIKFGLAFLILHHLLNMSLYHTALRLVPAAALLLASCTETTSTKTVSETHTPAKTASNPPPPPLPPTPQKHQLAAKTAAARGPCCPPRPPQSPPPIPPTFRM